MLEKHPAIVEACVFDVKERQWGKFAPAHLEVNPPPDDIELWCYCRKSLASHKIPGRFHWVTEPAYTASGKKIRNSDKLNHS